MVQLVPKCGAFSTDDVQSGYNYYILQPNLVKQSLCARYCSKPFTHSLPKSQTWQMRNLRHREVSLLRTTQLVTGVAEI